MSILNENNKELFNTIAECLVENTLNGNIQWVLTDTLFSTDKKKTFVGYLSGQKFHVDIYLKGDQTLKNGMLVIFDDKFDDGFILSNSIKTDHVQELSNYLFDSIKDSLVNNEEKVLNSILSKVGKDYIREKRLEKLLDKKENKESKEKKKNNIWSKFRK